MGPAEEAIAPIAPAWLRVCTDCERLRPKFLELFGQIEQVWILSGRLISVSAFLAQELSGVPKYFMGFSYVVRFYVTLRFLNVH